jgi:hypothetical protein
MVLFRAPRSNILPAANHLIGKGAPLKANKLKLLVRSNNVKTNMLHEEC